jgi:hypothetical protein
MRGYALLLIVLSLLSPARMRPDTPAPSLSDHDVRYLARLCTVEVRGMGKNRDIACMSVVSTVLYRMAHHELSDGTVKGTIAWNCKAGDEGCQFPAYTVNGCDGILPQACPLSYPDTVSHFAAVVAHYLAGHGKAPGVCEGYLYYGNQPYDRGGCEIAGPTGVEGWHH